MLDGITLATNDREGVGLTGTDIADECLIEEVEGLLVSLDDILTKVAEEEFAFVRAANFQARFGTGISIRANGISPLPCLETPEG
ncbi:hypothetical protein H7H48_15870 [Nitratireductor sp. B36]|uniref:hypothetical protein n=1 Tax=Nitratireductor sp. B36 TaxID=2762059 RepID=UPI001E4B106D|nr:hypothetical protein [Nitratireductor sp. B36]MCC5780539.1 hypothetical protein [Nitratireductor sp. B36]